MLDIANYTITWYFTDNMLTARLAHVFVCNLCFAKIVLLVATEVSYKQFRREIQKRYPNIPCYSAILLQVPTTPISTNIHICIITVSICTI